MSESGHHISTPHAAPARIVLIEREPAIAALYLDALRLRLRDADVAVLTLDDPRLGDALSAAEVCVCSVGTNPDGRFDDLVTLLLARPEVPVVVLIPACSADLADRAVELGAADVLLRTPGYLDQLPITVRRAALHARGVGYADGRARALRTALDGIREENRTLQQLIRQLESLAATDPLTGLPNRRAFERALARSVALSRRHGHELSCLMIDADGFKAVNDTLGHAAGDALLRLIADVIIQECRESDIAARLGGDEFAVLLPHTDLAAAAAVAERLRTRFAAEARARLVQAPCADKVGLTIGVASRELDAADSAEGLIEAADRAMYQGKREGRNRVTVSAAPIRRAA